MGCNTLSALYLLSHNVARTTMTIKTAITVIKTPSFLNKTKKKTEELLPSPEIAYVDFLHLV